MHGAIKFLGSIDSLVALLDVVLDAGQSEGRQPVPGGVDVERGAVVPGRRQHLLHLLQTAAPHALVEGVDEASA